MPSAVIGKCGGASGRNGDRDLCHEPLQQVRTGRHVRGQDLAKNRVAAPAV
jgi:hypothetical protein